MSGEIYVQDFAALETLFKRFYKPLRAYAFRFVNDKDLSEDIVQDVFYELWKRRESIRFEDESVKSYLFKAVYTHALNALDKKQQDVYPLKPERETDILDQYVSSYMQNSEQSLLLKELEEEIKRLEKELEAAPDDASLPQGTVSDGTMTPGIWHAGNSEVQTLELDVADDKAHLYVRTPGNENQNATGYLHYSTDIEDVNYYEGSLTKITSEDASDNVSISYDHALQLCNEFFAAGKVDDVVLGEAFLVRAGEAYAYRFDFVHDVNGVPAAWIRHTAPPDDDYALPWQYERIDIMVDGNGINAIFWQEPTLTGEILSEDTKIISFDEAGKVFEKMILASYEAQTTLFDTERNISIDISQIQLAPIRIREVNAQGRNGIYVPAWIFYGSLKEDIIENSTVSFSSTTGSAEEPHIMLAINAIDGSIIDLDKGY